MKKTDRTDDLVKYALVPIVLAVASGGSVALAALAAGLIARAIWGLPLKIVALVTFNAGAAAGVASAWYFFIGPQGAQRMLYVAETVLGVDMPFGPTHDGEVGDPERFVVEVHQGNRVFYLGGATKEQWRAFVDEMVNGQQNTSESHWCGAGKPFSKDEEFIPFRKELMDRGLARWRNPRARQQGWVLTRGGEALMESSARELGL